MAKAYETVPQCEATKAGNIPPVDSEAYEQWRKAQDPDCMGFDGSEVTDEPTNS